MKSKNVTIKDVADKANVSKATVSYVLNDVDKVSAETKQRVLDAIDELGYIPNSVARDLAKQTPIETSNYNNKETFIEDYPFYQEFMDSFLQNKLGKISRDTKNKLLRTIAELGYLPSSFLGQLIKQAKTTIAIFMEMERDFKHKVSENSPFYQEFINGIEHTAQENNLSIRIFNTNDFINNTDDIFDQSHIGAIVVGKLPSKLSVMLQKSQLPVVVVDEYESHPNFITVTSEDKKGAFDSIEYLILSGHKSIAFIGCENDKGKFVEWRLEGYKQALEMYGIAFKQSRVYLSEVNYSYDEGIRIAQKIAESEEQYDAIFCTSDIMAIGLMKGLMKKGITVPNDISIMGFDNIQFSKYSNPELTTVDQNIFLKAQTAVLVIKRKAEGEPVKKEYVLPATIVERESVIRKKR